MRLVKIVLKSGQRHEFPDVDIQSKDDGRMLAVFDNNYRIVAEFPVDSIDTVEEFESSLPAFADSVR